MNKRLLKCKNPLGGFFGCVLMIASFQNDVSAKANFLISSTNSFLKLESKVNWENITGTVTDSKGEPLIGVTVKIKGTTTGTVTDVNGVFRLNLPTGKEVLVISYLGFETKEVAMAGKTQIKISLVESNSSLDEVVVTGYGSKKRSEIVGSVATITGEELQDIPAPNIAGALRNRIAGLSVSENSGRPGSSISLNIRNSSVSEQGAIIGARSTPLYIIDGITMPPDDNTFDNLDLSMVDNIVFLKDAAAAIYGAAGAKGVVLVTTKKGKIGKPSISYNGYVGVSDAAQTPEMLSAYDLATLLNDTYRVQGNVSGSAFFSDQDLEYIKNLKYKSWYDEIWSPSLTQRHNLSVSGGSEKITFFVGGSYQNEDGNYSGLKQDRYGFRSGITAKVIDGLTAELNFNVDNRIKESNNTVSETDATFFESVITTPQWIPISIDGKFVNTSSGTTVKTNPLAVLNSGYYNNTKSQGYRINASLSYQPKFLKGLTAKLQISQAGTSSRGRQYIAPYNLYNFARMGNNNALYSNTLAPDSIYQAVTAVQSSVSPSSATGNNYQGFFTLQYGHTFGLHSVDLTVGGEQSRTYDETLAIKLNNQLIPGNSDWFAFDQTTLVRTASDISESTKRSFFGRFNYDFDKKYLIEAVARLDASSNFATGNRWGLSPSVGLGWIVSKENFFKNNVSFINFLKLKANVGIVGDDRVNARLWQARYTVDGAGNGYLFGTGNNGLGLNPSVFPNLDITWEKKRTINVGLESSLFNNKIDFGMEFFQNHTYDGFDKGANKTFPQYAGFTAPIVNFRQVYNWGSEFTLGYKTKIAKKVNLNASMNFGYGNSVITDIIFPINDAVIQNEADGSWLGNRIGTDPRKYNSANIGLKSLGMFRTQDQVDAFLAQNPNYKLYSQTPQPGWLYYEDVNGDGVINDYDMVPLYDNTNPFFSTGITLGVSYKDFALNVNIAARLGGKVFYDSRARSAPNTSLDVVANTTIIKSSTTRNVLSIWEDRWTPENPMEGKFPRFDDPTIVKNSDFWAVDGTTIRVNNMTLSYKLPTKLAQRAGLSNARLLLTGNNLWTIVNPLPYKDPYTSSAYNYPTLRTISMGLSVNL